MTPLAALLVAVLAVTTSQAQFKHFPAVGGGARDARPQAVRSGARPPGSREAAQDRQQSNELEPREEVEEVVRRVINRSRTRSRPQPLAAAVPAVPKTPQVSERRRVALPRRRTQTNNQVQNELASAPAPRLRVRATTARTTTTQARTTTTPRPTTRQFIPDFTEPEGQSLQQSFGNIFKPVPAVSRGRAKTTQTTPLPTTRFSQPATTPLPTTRFSQPATTPFPTTRFIQPSTRQPTARPFVFLPAGDFQAAKNFQSKDTLPAFPAVQQTFETVQPRQESFQAFQPQQENFQSFQPRQEVFQPVQPQQESFPTFQPRQQLQPVQEARAPLVQQRTPKLESMFDSSSLFSQDLTRPQDTGDGVYFSYSAIL